MKLIFIGIVELYGVKTLQWEVLTEKISACLDNAMGVPVTAAMKSNWENSNFFQPSAAVTSSMLSL